MRHIVLTGLLFFVLIAPTMTQVSSPPVENPDVQPKIKGGNKAMMKLMAENFDIPDTIADNHLAGNMTIEFVVDIDGLAKEVKVINSIGYGIDKEILEIFDLMNQQRLWIPGKKDRKPVPVLYSMPFDFTAQELTDRQKAKLKCEPD